MTDFNFLLRLRAAEKPTDADAEENAHSSEDATPPELEEGRLPAILGYVPFLFFVPLFGAKKNKFALRHGRQAFVLFIIEIIALLFLIDVVSEFFWTVVFVATLGLALVACVNAAQGRVWNIPYLGDLIKKFDLFGGN